MSCYSEGDPNSRICLIGEAPARNEVRMDRPFVGPAGSVLDECLHAAGLVRAECYITNVFEHEVSKNLAGDIKLGDDPMWSHTKGFTQEANPYLFRLYERLRQCNANIFVPLGGVALEALTSHKGITKWRGSIMEATKGIVGRKLVPTIHPAAVLRGQALLKYPIVNDLRRAGQEADGPQINATPREILLDPSFSEARDFLTEARHCKLVSTDIEVTGHGISCFSVATSPNLVMSIPLFSGRGDHWTEQDEASIWCWYAELLGDPMVAKINQNISFDLGFLFHNNDILFNGPIHDTMVAQGICYPDFPKGLDFITSLYTREPYYKDDGKTWYNVKDWPRFWRYNALDSATVLEAWPALLDEMQSGGYMRTYELTMRCLRPIIYMQTRGFKVDMQRLEATREQISTELAAKRLELDEVAEVPFNPASPKQCMEYFYVRKKIKPYTSRSTGKVTTDDQAMARIVARYGLREARLVQDIRNLSKLQGTYLDVTLDPDERIRTQYNIRGTTTGRLSSGKTVFGTGLGMQNLDPKFKQFLVAD